MKNNRSLAPALAGIAILFTVFGAPLRAETYVLTLYETTEQLDARTDPARAAAYWESFADFGRELQQAGLIRGGSAFDAKSVRHVSSTVGHQADNSPRRSPALSGYFIIETPSIDEALHWAARSPNVAHGGTVSVFPCVKSPAMN